MIGKNALQKTGTKVVTNSNLAEFMKPGLNPISNAYYDVVNFVIDPKTIAYGTAGVEIANDIFNDSMPAGTLPGRLYYIYDNWDTFKTNINTIINKD